MQTMSGLCQLRPHTYLMHRQAAPRWPNCPGVSTGRLASYPVAG